jgi:hypothetical protein
MNYDVVLVGEDNVAQDPFTSAPMRCYRAMFAQKSMSLTVAQLVRSTGRWPTSETPSAPVHRATMHSMARVRVADDRKL